MLKLPKRVAVVAIAVLAASAPSAAYARLNLDLPATAPVVSPQTVHTAASPSAGKASASATQGFQWDDAGVGAAGVIILASISSGTMLVLRRRTQHPLAS